MRTSHFQLGLIATLAVGLGFSLASSQAVGYPAGAAVSHGANPIWARAGEIADTEVETIITAPADQDVVVTNISIYSTGSSSHFWLRLDDGTVLGRYFANSHHLETLASGLPVPAGRTLQLQRSSGGHNYYNFSGYYAQP